MARLFKRNNDLFLKLAATSMGLTIATARLYAYCNSVANDMEKDRCFVLDLEQAYRDSGYLDEKFAENFSKVSAETDELLLELGKCRIH